MVHSRKMNRHVRLITMLTIAIIGIIVIIVGVSFIIGNKLAPSSSPPVCYFRTMSGSLVISVTGPDCDATVQWAANQTGGLWTVAPSATPTALALMDEVAKGPDTVRLYAAQQPRPIHAALLLSARLQSAGWAPTETAPATTPAPTA